MRVVFWTDMEGIGGILHWDHVNGGSPLYEEGRRLYTGEISAAVRGAKRGGATSILAVDGHGAGQCWTFNSWIKDQLEPGAQYVSGHRWGCYVDPFKDECDALLVVGAHAMGGTADGVLSHTMSASSWYSCWINGRETGEVGLMAAIAGSFDIPLIFVSGDEAVCRETRAFVGDSVVTAPVKKGLGRFTARYLPAHDSQALIESKVAQALSDKSKWPKPLKLESPVELKIEFMHPDRTNDFRGNREGIEIVGPRTVVSRGPDFWTVWNQFWHY